ncbi:MAG: energy transducer TonB [Bacteroidota bacterium]
MKSPTLFFGLLLLIMGTCVSLYAQDNSSLPPRVKNITVLDPLKYPSKAIRKGIKGLVKVEIEVDDAGKYVAHNIVESAHDMLAQEVEPFIPQLMFHPAEKEGEAVKGLAILSLRFSIQRKVPPKTEITIRFLDPDLGG